MIGKRLPAVMAYATQSALPYRERDALAIGDGSARGTSTLCFSLRVRV